MPFYCIVYCIVLYSMLWRSTLCLISQRLTSFWFVFIFCPPYISTSFHRHLQVCEVKTACLSNNLRNRNTKNRSAACYSHSNTSALLILLFSMHYTTASLFEPATLNPSRCRWSYWHDRFNRPLMSLWNAHLWQSNKELKLSADFKTDQALSLRQIWWTHTRSRPDAGQMCLVKIQSSLSCCSETCELNNV